MRCGPIAYQAAKDSLVVEAPPDPGIECPVNWDDDVPDVGIAAVAVLWLAGFNARKLPFNVIGMRAARPDAGAKGCAAIRLSSVALDKVAPLHGLGSPAQVDGEPVQ